MTDYPPLSPKAVYFVYYAVNPHTFENYAAGYLSLWEKMSVLKRTEADRQAELLLAHADVYKRVEAETKVPWIVVGVLHLREAGPQDVGRWRGILHNGELIVGTGRRSSLVPRGVGPFSSWHEAAVHAIRSEGLDKFQWNVARVAFASEKFNGFGYRGRGIPSPYLWGGTSVQQRGKYTSDGRFNRDVKDPQLGTMAVLRALMDKTGFTFDAKAPQGPGAISAAPSSIAPAPRASWWQRVASVFKTRSV